MGQGAVHLDLQVEIWINQLWAAADIDTYTEYNRLKRMIYRVIIFNNIYAGATIMYVIGKRPVTEAVKKSVSVWKEAHQYNIKFRSMALYYK